MFASLTVFYNKIIKCSKATLNVNQINQRIKME